MPGKITVSNGRYCKQIDRADLATAREQGFERPFDRHTTIVGNDRWVFEIPIGELKTIAGSDLKELVSAEREEWRNPERSTPEITPEIPSGLGVPSSESSPSTSRSGSTLENLLTQLDQAETEARHERVLREQQVEKSTGWRRYGSATQLWWHDHRSRVLKQVRSNGISAAVHISLLLILASLFLEAEEEPKSLILASSTMLMPEVEEMIIDATPLEITEPTESEQEEQSSETDESEPQVFEAPNFMGAVRGDAIKPPSKPSSASGDANSMALKESSFFGNKVTAVDYVFVIDNSNSMTGGRFETALNELMISVSQLTPRQRFYVIFYSDTAYPMFHPRPAKQLLNATPRNKEMLRRWLGTVQLCLRTDGKQAIQSAFQLQPDVIFVLGDGAFTDKASAFFASKPQKKIPLHTLGMEVKPKDAITFQRLAEANGGTYKDVGVSPQAKAFAKMNPRPRNTTRGPIWGLLLKPK